MNTWFNHILPWTVFMLNVWGITYAVKSVLSTIAVLFKAISEVIKD